MLKCSPIEKDIKQEGINYPTGDLESPEINNLTFNIITIHLWICFSDKRTPFNYPNYGGCDFMFRKMKTLLRQGFIVYRQVCRKTGCIFEL